MRRAGFPLISIGRDSAGTFLTMELVLRFPAGQRGRAPPVVDHEHPVRSLGQNRTFVWSADWNFAIVNVARTNNLGFVSDQDYLLDQPSPLHQPSPLLALIGDSYVRSLDGAISGERRRTTDDPLHPNQTRLFFGTSSSALSNYLAYADYAAKRFHPQAMVFVIIGNDFDESLLKYKE